MKEKKYCIVYNINDNALNAVDLKRNDFFIPGLNIFILKFMRGVK